MTIRLRAHHLLCMLTYAGEGYNRAFTAKFDAVANRIGAGEDVLIIAGPDDLCAALLEAPDAHCFRDSVRERDALAASDLCTLLGVSIVEGERLMFAPARLLRMREAFVAGKVRQACHGCEWHGLCTAVARRGFRDAKLGPP